MGVEFTQGWGKHPKNLVLGTAFLGFPTLRPGKNCFGEYFQLEPFRFLLNFPGEKRFTFYSYLGFWAHLNLRGGVSPWANCLGLKGEFFLRKQQERGFHLFFPFSRRNFLLPARVLLYHSSNRGLTPFWFSTIFFGTHFLGCFFPFPPL